jgi:prepilin-type N-terminal cleavage/methylation domain-containing protein
MVKSIRGFSLIEILVATAILSMVLMISSMGYSFFMERWHKADNKFSVVTQTAKKFLLTKEVVTGYFPYILRKDDGTGGIYFEGNSDSFIGITGRSVFAASGIAVARMSIEKQADFSYNLVYEEHLLDKSPFLRIEQEFEFENKVVLLLGITDIRFTYFGARDLAADVDSSENIWWQTFNALSRKIMPRIIRITFVDNQKQYSFDFPLSQADKRTLTLYQNDLF